MTIIVIIKKADINTTVNGLNYHITLPNGLVLNFTKAAIQEMYNDMIALDLLFKQQHEDKTQAEFYNVSDVDE